jgi:beta-galactosidase
MFHGGTNFGLTSGANDKGIYQPIVTSYDYDAPLSEDGWPTEKYWAFRDVLSRYTQMPELLPGDRPPAPTPAISLQRSVPLTAVADLLGTQVETPHVPTMDELGCYQGFILQATDLPGRDTPALLSVAEVRDRALVMVDGVPVGTLSREDEAFCLPVPAGPPSVVTLLVEDQGRVNYGKRIGEPKGVVGPVLLDGHELSGWRSRWLELDLERVLQHCVPVTRDTVAGPAFVVATFDLDTPGDLYLDTGTWRKGVAWVNGFCLGRYWSRGPQRTLYVPGPATRAGANELVLFELHGGDAAALSFRSAPDLGPSEV